jgi:hypothetical protein
MKLHIACLAGVVAFADAAAWAQTTQVKADPPIVYSGLFAVRDGRRLGSAAQTGEHVGADLAGTVYLTPCSGMGAASPGRPVSAFATDIWLMSGKVVELSEEQVSVQVGWRRTRRGGQEESSPEQSITLTLKRGERNTLESVPVAASGSCEARTVLLEVVFASRQELYAVTDADLARGNAGGGRAVVSGPTVSVQGAGRYPPGGSASSFGASKTPHPALEALTADLWLVRSTPGRADETLHITKQVSPFPVAYAFAPLAIQSVSGTVSVKVEGTVEAGLAPEGEPRFHFTAGRTVTSSTSNRPALDGKPLVEGSTKTTVALPGPDEVISFEMPPLRAPDGVTLPDRLSIRVRLSSSPK